MNKTDLEVILNWARYFEEMTCETGLSDHEEETRQHIIRMLERLG